MSSRFTHAIVCRVPDSINKAIGVENPIDLAKCRRQHEAYVQALRDAGLDVIELPADEQQPDCTFVEDTAVVCNGIALLCRPQPPSRRQEVKYMKSILQKELNLPVMEISDESATLEGGDVLFTGREFFVGLSERSSRSGAVALANAFPEFPCSPVKVDGALHLKSLLTMAGPDVICVAKDKHAQEVLKRIESCASFTYKTVTVDDICAANCVYANGTLLHRAASELPESAKVITSKLGHLKLRGLEFSELQKADGSLTCCSILVSQPKHLRSLS
ncbi:N(G),N(G)-dimethylarginine dimethylaminohydrolase 1 [Hyalella azteca]|uniref:N(G),N(G)-dimethylarginine dimethylaminohydrolase 1 n=1 Tax=Hyalella azteca TaxID=294128 RepID=A0A8B7N6N3_HYAAZ|nr:N(G),N(G)-dimethylarginine dimethylaminohydrolase 1 [Hyalella azteca]